MTGGSWDIASSHEWGARLKWDRPFQVWSYSVSHRLLLLRSTASEKYPGQVDVLFEDVRALALPTSLLGLEIELVDCKSLVSGPWCAEAVKGFLVRAGDAEGYVIARQVRSHEGAGEYFDRSPLMPNTHAL